MTLPVVLPLGREAAAWVRQGGMPSRAGWSHRFMLRWQSYWFEHNLALQRQLPPPSPLRTDPLFILGLWRSGTTYLHDLLSACPEMISPAWQCMSPASFRLQSARARGNAVQRPMDGLTVDNFSPQEDEFALLALGVPSVYRGFVDPRRLTELTQWLNPDAWASDQPAGWAEIWRQFLAGVADGHRERLVLKSPNHLFRVQALANVFPNATYVWLVRDPTDTLLSNRKMWHAMFERYAFWEWDDSILTDFLAQAFRLAAECLLSSIGLSSKEQLVVVPFDQLVNRPLDTLERLNHRIRIGKWQDMKPGLLRIVSAKKDYRHDTYNGREVPDSSKKVVEQLSLAQFAALSSHGL